MRGKRVLSVDVCLKGLFCFFLIDNKKKYKRLSAARLKRTPIPKTSHRQLGAQRSQVSLRGKEHEFFGGTWTASEELTGSDTRGCRIQALHGHELLGMRPCGQSWDLRACSDRVPWNVLLCHPPTSHSMLSPTVSHNSAYPCVRSGSADGSINRRILGESALRS